MQHFTQEDLQPRESTILLIKQFARQYNQAKSAERQSAQWCLN